MASKIIAPFIQIGPYTPAAIDGWLSQCEGGFAIYGSTRSEKATQLQECSAVAWWNPGRQEFLKLSSWDHIQKKVYGYGLQFDCACFS